MTNGEQATGGLDFKDRKAGLIVFGILQILLGAFCALLVPLMIVGMLLSAQPMGAGTMAPGILFYALMSTWFIWMGIGSIQARRWARALLLVSSWIWLISGIWGLVFMLVFMPVMYDQMGEIFAVIAGVTIGFMAVFYVIIPGALVLFYGSRHVKATCEKRDPHIRWTDKCPLPVLAVSLVSGLGAASILLMGFYGWATPFFGSILSGIAGAGVVLVSSLLLGYVAWGTYRLSVNAWWCAILMIIFWGISNIVTFSRVSLIEFYEKMNFPDQQLAMMKQLDLPQEPLMILICGMWIVVAMAYLFYTRRFFASGKAKE